MDLYNMVRSDEFKALIPNFEEKKQQVVTKIDEEISKIKANMPAKFPYENYLDFDRFDYRNFDAYSGSRDCTILNCIRVLLDYQKNMGKKLDISSLVELDYVSEDINDVIFGNIEDYVDKKVEKSK